MTTLIGSMVFSMPQLFLLGIWLVLPLPTCAQVTPDETLSTTVSSPDQLNFIINAGNRAGGNLFHSFREFSVPTGGSAYFNNSVDIQNIITRVTGKSISNIDGLIRSNGAANLFLINPNGIVFGPHAALNVGGSFIGSTADHLKFSDGSEFSATNTQTSPLLTISVPVGLQYGSNPGAIRVQGSGNTLGADPDTFAIVRDPQPVGLQVPAGQTLALVGGDITLAGGNLTAEAGRVELGSVKNGFVKLTPIAPGWVLDYTGVENFQNIQLLQSALVDVSGDRSGDIQIQGERISISEGSVVLGRNQGTAPGGNLSLHASQEIEVVGSSIADGLPSGMYAEAGQEATGKGGNILLSTNRLRVVEGGYLSATTVGVADSGGLMIRANEVDVAGLSADRRLASNLNVGVGPISTGNGGNLTINTGRLRVTGGAELGSGTFGPGNAGTVNIQATEVEVSGVGNYVSGNLLSSLISVGANGGSGGNSGNLNISTERLLIADGGSILADTFSSGKAGNLTVNATEVVVQGTAAGGRPVSSLSTDVSRRATGNGGNLTLKANRLQIADGAKVSAETRGKGNSGELNIQANSVEVTGQSANGQFQSNILASSTGEGAAGNLRIAADNLLVRNGAQVNVSSQGKGAAGNLNIEARSIRLDRAGISAETVAGDRGSITLQAPDMIVLRRNSQITTSATGNATGGNISINTDNFVLTEDSAVIAQAIQGQGGRIQINTQGLFRTPESTIDASSALGIDGTVQITQPDVDPTSQLVELPINVINPTTLIARSCLAPSSQQGRFIITGAGGLPTSPYQALRSRFETYAIGGKEPAKAEQPGGVLLEAQGLYRLEDGQLVLGRECR